MSRITGVVLNSIIILFRCLLVFIFFFFVFFSGSAPSLSFSLLFQDLSDWKLPIFIECSDKVEDDLHLRYGEAQNEVRDKKDCKYCYWHQCQHKPQHHLLWKKSCRSKYYDTFTILTGRREALGLWWCTKEFADCFELANNYIWCWCYPS